MSETTGNNTKGKSGDTNTTTSGNKSGSGSGRSGSGKTTTGKQTETNVKSNLVEQGKPAEVVVTLETESPKGKNPPARKKAPAKKKQTAKQRSQNEQVKDIQSLLEGIFMVASLKAGEHWTLSSDESKQVALPLSRILERYDLLGKASEVSDPVALIVAVATITVPRVMLSKMSMEQTKAETLKKNGVMDDVKKTNVNGSSGSNGGTAKTPNQSNDGQFIKSLCSEI